MVSHFLKQLSHKILPPDVLERRSKQQWYAYKHSTVPTISQAIQTINQRWPAVNACPPTDSPIFLLSAQWRSGSTLVQRLINSDPQVLMWGEPFGDCNLIQSLADSVRALRADQPPVNYFIDSENFEANASRLTHRWTANLYPEITALAQAHRAFFQALFAEPAQQRGYQRWGIKEVRLTMEHAHYLYWLFPHARFVFLYRNPYRAYQSCRTWRNLYLRWPEEGIDSAQKFGHYWQNMVQEYLDNHQRVNGLLVKYEDLCSQPSLVQELGDYLGLTLTADILNNRIGSQRAKEPIPAVEIRQLHRAAEPLASRLGYEPPGG